MTARKWKPTKPAHSIGHATEMNLAHALKHQNRGIKTVAGLMGIKLDTFYKQLAEDRIPVCAVAAFENACGAHYLTDFLSAQAGRLVVAMPTGRSTPLNLAELQVFQSEVMALLMRCYERKANPRETADALTALLGEIAYQRANVLRMETPELDLFGGEE
jgi:hypothetical protein